VPSTVLPCSTAEGDDGRIVEFGAPARVSPLGYGIGAPPSQVGEGLAIAARDHRSGMWFHTRSLGDGNALPAPLLVAESPEATREHPYALRAEGPPPVGWGANVGVRFERCYDASAYAGVELRLKGKGVVFVGLQTPTSVPVDFGGRCTTRCWYTSGRNFALDGQFTTQRILWKDLQQQADKPVERELLQIMISLQSGPDPYELWVSDLRFVTQSELAPNETR